MSSPSLVSLVKGENRKNNIKNSLQLIRKDLLSFKKANSILIKPNLTSSYNPVANTHPDAVLAILDFFHDFDPGFSKKKITIAEASGEAFSRRVAMSKVYERFGFTEITEKYHNARLEDLNQWNNFLKVKIHTLIGKKAVRIPKKIFQFDYIISVALPKTHDTVGITLGIKNLLMGIVKQEDRSSMHGFQQSYSDYQELKKKNSLLNKIALLLIGRGPWQLTLFINNYLPSKIKDKQVGFNPQIYKKSVACLNYNLFQLGKRIMPGLVIIDGLIGMEGDGPVYGRVKKLGIAIASTDPLKADAVGAKVMGFEPQKIGYLRLFAKAQNENLSLIKTVGEEIEHHIIKFLPHRHFCPRFFAF